MGSLALEVVWTRALRLTFGSTTLAASTILVAYMLGLGVGGLLGGRVASRLRDGIRAYGWIEVAIGAYALAVPWLLSLLPELNRAVLGELSFWLAAFARFVVAALLLLVPTVLMGATLPIVVETLLRRDPRIARATGLLYGINTLGAVAGVFVATFVLFPWIGLRATNRFGALVDLAVGVLALLVVAPRFARWAAAPAAAPASSAAPVPAATTEEADEAPLPVWALLVTYATVGASALLYEVAWTRALAVVLGSSVYAFAAMLGAFLAGIALGSLLFRRWIEATAQPLRLLQGGMAALALLGLATTLALPHLPDLLLRWMAWAGADGRRLALAQVLFSAAAMLPPTLVLGGLFPLVTRLVARRARDGGDAVGKVYFANTLGSATGAFCAGFLLIPWLGLRDTLALGAALNLAASGALLVAAPRPSRTSRVAGATALVAAALLLVVPIPFDRVALARGVFQRPESALDFGLEPEPLEGVTEHELLYYRDGLNTTVSVEREGSTVLLRVNGKIDASNLGDMPTQVLVGEIPLLFGPPAKRVLVIGYASGVTVGSVARHAEVERIDAVEIEPAIIEASRFFDAQSGRPLDDERVHLVLDDARSFLAAGRGKYDVIISEPSNPWMTGVSNLFTREFFAIAHDALVPGGRLFQWVQLYALEPEALDSILAALHEQFRYVYGFSHAQNNPDLLLLATDRPLTRDDLPRWEELPAPVRADLERIGNFSTTDLWSLVRLLPKDVAALAAQAPIVNTDDNLHIELGTPWMLHRETVLPNWERFDRIAPRGVLPLLRAVGEPLDPERIAALALSYADRRAAPDVATRLLQTATARARPGHALAAALVVAREMDEEGRLALDDQLATLDEALAIAPDATEILQLRAQIALEGERYAEALRDAERVLALDPSALRARAVQVRALAGLGRHEEAWRALAPLLESTMVEVDPSLRQDEARLAIATGRLDEGRRLLESYLYGQNANWTDGWLLLADAYDRLGRPAEAAAARRNAQSTWRNYALMLHHRARGALWRGDPATAATYLDMVLTLDPENDEARRERAALAAQAAGS